MMLADAIKPLLSQPRGLVQAKPRRAMPTPRAGDDVFQPRVHRFLAEFRARLITRGDEDRRIARPPRLDAIGPDGFSDARHITHFGWRHTNGYQA